MLADPSMGLAGGAVGGELQDHQVLVLQRSAHLLSPGMRSLAGCSHD